MTVQYNKSRRHHGRRRHSHYKKKKRSTFNYYPQLCKKDMTFEECELAILRQAVDDNENANKTKIANSDGVKKMISIVEDFLQKTKCICYGGTAINNILPEEAQFYDRTLDIPDYDFFSQDPVNHAKELANIFNENGYSDVEAKAGVHYGTYKVFVNFIPMADITLLHPELYSSIQKEAIIINGIYYTPANFLRMSMFLELSRPEGDVSRWEKVLKRLTLLNRYYPLKVDKCFQVDFQRSMDYSQDKANQLYCTIKDTFIQQRVVFFGGYATSLYSRYMPKKLQRIVKSIPDFDVLSVNPEQCAQVVLKNLHDHGFTNAKSRKFHEIGEVIPTHYEIYIGNDTLAFIYEPIACHNYNEIVIQKQTIRVATIDTILSFYLAFLYANVDNFVHFKDRFLCMSQYLFQVEQENRLAQKGLLKRFTLKCYGTQPTLETIRAKKTEMFEKLRNKKNDDPEKEAWFLRYTPGEKSSSTSTKKETQSPKQSAKPVLKKTRKNTKKNTKVTRKSKKKDYFF